MTNQSQTPAPSLLRFLSLDLGIKKKPALDTGTIQQQQHSNSQVETNDRLTRPKRKTDGEAGWLAGDDEA